MSNSIQALIPLNGSQLTSALLFAVKERLEKQLTHVASRDSIKVIMGGTQSLYFSFEYTDFNTISEQRVVNMFFASATDYSDALEGHKIIISTQNDDIGLIILKTLTEGFSGIIIDDNRKTLCEFEGQSFVITSKNEPAFKRTVSTLLDALSEATYFKFTHLDANCANINVHLNIQCAIVVDLGSKEQHVYEYKVA
jgi:hypothetical protein